RSRFLLQADATIRFTQRDLSHEVPFRCSTHWRSHMHKCSLSMLAIAALCAVCSPVHADDDGKLVFKSPLIACPHDGTILGGIHSCGKAWVIKDGTVRLSADGKLKIDVDGLVLNDPTLPSSVNGTPDGVDAVVAAVICGGSGGAIEAQTALTTI